MRSKIDRRLAINASPSHKAARPQTLVIVPPARLLIGTCPESPIKQQKTHLAVGHERPPTARSAVGVISRCGRFRGTPSPSYYKLVMQRRPVNGRAASPLRGI